MAINPTTGQLFKTFEALSDLQIDGHSSACQQHAAEPSGQFLRA